MANNSSSSGVHGPLFSPTLLQHGVLFPLLFLVVVSVAVATDFVGAVAGFLMFSFYLNFRFAYCFAFSFKTFSLGLAWLGLGL